MTSAVLLSLVWTLPSAGFNAPATSPIHTVAAPSGCAAEATGCCPSDCVPVTTCMPEWCIEKRTVKEIRYRTEEKTRDLTYYKQAQVTKQLESKCTKFVRVTKTEEQKYTVSTPVCKTIEDKVTVLHPRQEIRHGTRKVCRLVPGTCDQYETVEEPYECCVTVCDREERVVTRKVWETKKEEKVAQNKVCTIEPRVTVTKYDVQVCEWQPHTRQEKYNECVPYTVEKVVEVQVCRLVPKTVYVPKCCRD